MIPAPAQGAMLVVAMENDEFTRKALKLLNHRESEISVHIEREFLQVLEGGCTAPIGALATIKNDLVYFKGALFSLDGKQRIGVEKTISIDNIQNFGRSCAEKVLAEGGKELMRKIKTEINSKA